MLKITLSVEWKVRTHPGMRKSELFQNVKNLKIIECEHCALTDNSQIDINSLVSEITLSRTQWHVCGTHKPEKIDSS